MNTSAKIYVAGHLGMVGSALARSLRAGGFSNLITRSRAELDLTDGRAVHDFFFRERPEYVFLAAAKVGGILANFSYPAEFISQNLLIQTNVIQEAYKSGVRRLLFLGSSCIYPKHAPQPIKEEYLLTGPLEETNRPYAIAKISGIEMCWSYNRQHGTCFLAAMPTNLYGPNDNYDLRDSHVVPSLIRKIHEANANGTGSVAIWGTGEPRREFLYSDDAAEACVFLMQLPEKQFRQIAVREQMPPIVNVGYSQDITIRHLAELICDVVGFDGSLTFDSAMPDGTPQKLLDTSRLAALGWKPKTSLREGLEKTYRIFKESFASSAKPNLTATTS